MNMNFLLRIIFCFLLVITSVRADVDMDNIYSQQGALGESMKNSRISNKEELETFFLNAINATFSAGCSTYNTYIDSKSISSLISKTNLTNFFSSFCLHFRFGKTTYCYDACSDSSS